MKCFYCEKAPDELEEYIVMARVEKTTPEEFVLSEEGTYNKELDTFCCTECYKELGCPSSPDGWKAGQPIN